MQCLVAAEVLGAVIVALVEARTVARLGWMHEQLARGWPPAE